MTYQDWNGETENLNRSIMNEEIESVNKNLPFKKEEIQDLMAHGWNVPNIEAIIDGNPFQIPLKNWRGGDASELISQRQHFQYPCQASTLPGKKIQATVPDQKRCWRPQQNTKKPNSTTHWNAPASWLAGTCPWKAKMLQETQIDKREAPP